MSNRESTAAIVEVTFQYSRDGTVIDDYYAEQDAAEYIAKKCGVTVRRVTSWI